MLYNYILIIHDNYIYKILKYELLQKLLQNILTYVLFTCAYIIFSSSFTKPTRARVAFHKHNPIVPTPLCVSSPVDF